MSVSHVCEWVSEIYEGVSQSDNQTINESFSQSVKCVGGSVNESIKRESKAVKYVITPVKYDH